MIDHDYHARSILWKYGTFIDGSVMIGVFGLRCNKTPRRVKSWIRRRNKVISAPLYVGGSEGISVFTLYFFRS